MSLCVFHRAWHELSPRSIYCVMLFLPVLLINQKLIQHFFCASNCYSVPGRGCERGIHGLCLRSEIISCLLYASALGNWVAERKRLDRKGERGLWVCWKVQTLPLFPFSWSSFGGEKQRPWSKFPACVQIPILLAFHMALELLLHLTEAHFVLLNRVYHFKSDDVGCLVHNVCLVSISGY